MKAVIFSHLMLRTENHILRLVLFTAILLFSCSNPATAHVEKGTMPDSVAEMEYLILLEFEPDNFEVRIQLGMVLFRSEKYKEGTLSLHTLRCNIDYALAEANTTYGIIGVKVWLYKEPAKIKRK